LALSEKTFFQKAFTEMGDDGAWIIAVIVVAVLSAILGVIRIIFYCWARKKMSRDPLLNEPAPSYVVFVAQTT
jgi:hypothetical protein